MFCNYVQLFIDKIYNHIEDAVLRICLLVPQDINSVQKSVFAVYCYNVLVAPVVPVVPVVSVVPIVPIVPAVQLSPLSQLSQLS